MGFVQKIAEFVKEKDLDLGSLTIIVPSDRAINKIKQELARLYARPILSPQIITIDKWMRVEGKSKIDPTRQLITLYEISSKIAPFKDQSFEDFLSWGNTLLKDFDEVDRYLLDAKAVFKNLKSIKELETWQIDDEELSSSQKKFKEFWGHIPHIYRQFHEHLEREQKTTSGRAYRDFNDAIIDEVSKLKGKHKFIFAGFNALSLSELSVMKKLVEMKCAFFISDADHFYTGDSIHEAGSFIRKNHEFLNVDNPIPVLSSIGEKNMNITIVECSQQIGQVKVAANELSKLSIEEQNNTLVLLCDESLISSVTKNIPSSIVKTNVSLGLPITQTAIKSWVDILFQIQENKLKFGTESIYFYDFQRFINHSVTLSCTTIKEMYLLGDIERDAIKKNRIFQSIDSIKISDLMTTVVDLTFENWNNDWKKALDNIRTLNSVIIKNISAENSFERTIIQVFDESLVELQNIIEEGIPKMSQKSFKLFFDQHWSQKNIAFKGDQKEGVQVMGLLETRLLDFKHIIALGMNEGKLPATNQINSFIPMDLRAALGLPTTREKQGLFAHHFYRLLHHCDTLTATYSSNNEQLGPQEKSRYLLQLELELQRINENIQITNKFYNVPIEKASSENAQVIEKSDLIMGRIEKYFNRAISASSINTYLRCPLDFYYRYIAELGEEKSIEEDIESQQFGSLIHNTLEKLFDKHALLDSLGNENTPKPNALEESDLNQMLVDYKELLYNEFLNYFDNESQLFLEGKNLVSYTIAQDTIENTIKKELEFLKKQSEPFYIVQVEAKKEISLEILVSGQKKTIHFKGYIDRIDKIGDSYRVIDYKSGKVKESDVKFKLKDKDLLVSFTNCKHGVQLALYSLFFKSSFGTYPSEAIIYSLTDVSKIDHKLSYDNHSLADICQLFEAFIQEVLNEIFNDSSSIDHNEKAKYCNYCQ
jgi:RecB family exonuclease